MTSGAKISINKKEMPVYRKTQVENRKPVSEYLSKGESLKSWRKKKKLTLVALSERTKISIAQLSNYENGLSPIPEEAEKILSETLNIPKKKF